MNQLTHSCVTLIGIVYSIEDLFSSKTLSSALRDIEMSPLTKIQGISPTLHVVWIAMSMDRNLNLRVFAYQAIGGQNEYIK
jgi:hypothetical protein